jgi:hypothetical protein
LSYVAAVICITGMVRIREIQERDPVAVGVVTEEL